MLPMYGNSLSYRSRPYNNDPEWCRFEVWSLDHLSRWGRNQAGLASVAGRYDRTDADNWGLIPRQDFSNIERQQRGLHTR